MGSLLDWVNIFRDQMLWSVLSVAILAILFGKKEKQINGENWKILLFVFIAPLILFTGKHDMPHLHYPIPFIGAILIALAVSIKNYTPNFLQSKKVQIGLVLIVLFGFKYTQGFEYKHMNDEVIHWQKCRAEAKVTWKKVRDLQKDGRFVVADPYTPGDVEFEHLRNRYWGIDWNIIYKKDDVKVILLKRPYFNRYYHAPSRDYGKEATDRWDDIRAFYKELDTKTVTIDPKGFTWNKVHDDACGHIIWVKAK
jgi:hypothetical protein